MTRRSILFLTLAVLTALANADARPPNVMLIVGDDHRNDTYNAFGGDRVKTPNLDRLARAGARFERAYANSPMCTSSRQSFLTGQYPHAIGVTMLRHVLDDEPVTLADRLQEAGYRTGAFGKMHFNSDQLHGFEVHRTPREFRRDHNQRPADRPLPEGIKVLPPWKPFQDHARIWLNGFYRPVGRYDDEMPGTWYAREAIAFMTEHREEPFFVQVGFHQPHSPFQFPVEYAKPPRFFPGLLDVPEPGPEDGSQIPKIFAGLTKEDKQGIIASYLTSVMFLDLNVGRLLTALDELGLADDTLVIYLGDHGYHLGEHGRFEKHCFYENAVRAPLVMRWPGRIPGGKASKALVEFVDVVPTVLDYADQPIDRDADWPATLHGYSLRPLIEGKERRLRTAVFSEYQPTEEAMIRTDRYKLIYSTSNNDVNWLGYEPVVPPTGAEIRLFDVARDPEEFENLADDPRVAAVRSGLLTKLANWYRQIPPRGEQPPTNLDDLAMLEWAIPPRDAPPRPE